MLNSTVHILEPLLLPSGPGMDGRQWQRLVNQFETARWTSLHHLLTVYLADTEHASDSIDVKNIAGISDHSHSRSGNEARGDNGNHCYAAPSLSSSSSSSSSPWCFSLPLVLVRTLMESCLDALEVADGHGDVLSLFSCVRMLLAPYLSSVDVDSEVADNGCSGSTESAKLRRQRLECEALGNVLQKCFQACTWSDKTSPQLVRSFVAILTLPSVFANPHFHRSQLTNTTDASDSSGGTDNNGGSDGGGDGCFPYTNIAVPTFKSNAHASTSFDGDSDSDGPKKRIRDRNKAKTMSSTELPSSSFVPPLRRFISKLLSLSHTEAQLCFYLMVPLVGMW